MKENFYYVEKTLGAKNLSDLEVKVLSYIVSNIDEAQKIGVRGVAEKNFTSTATVMRVAKKLEYKGFLEMIYNLKNKIRLKEVETEVNQEIIKDDYKFYNLAKVRDYKDLDSIKELINDKVIYLYSEGYGEYITEYMYRKLLVRRKLGVILHGLEVPIIYKGEESPTLFIISRSGETKSCLAKVEQIRKVNGKVIAFTGKEGSSLYKVADVVFTITDNDKIDSENYYPTYFYGNCINTFEKIIELFMTND